MSCSNTVQRNTYNALLFRNLIEHECIFDDRIASRFGHCGYSREDQ